MLSGVFIYSQKQIVKNTPKLQIQNRHTRLVLITILAGSAVLYLYGLGHYSFQMDEYYHVAVSKTYFETGNIFTIGTTPYTRSALTSLITIGSQYIFSNISPNIPIEFALRFPFALCGLISIFFAFKISEKITTKSNALLITLFIATETYLMYFFTYTRFYALSIALILAMLYLCIHSKNRGITTFICILISYTGYLFVSEYFLFITCFFALLFVWNFAEKEQKSRLPLIIGAGILAGAILGTLVYRASIENVYNPFAWNLNTGTARNMMYWLYINYGPMLIVLVSIFIGYLSTWKYTLPRLTSQNIINTYVITNFLFIFIYVVNVPFNFTFRTTLFVLPCIFILYIIYLDKQYIHTKIGILFIIGLLANNIYMSIRYHADSVGEPYHPTKLVYEKIEIITDTKDLARYIASYSETIKKPEAIIYIGLGDTLLRYYLPKQLQDIPITAFRYSREYDSRLSDLTSFIEEHKEQNLLVVISANALPYRRNELYDRIYKKFYVTEANPSLSSHIKESPYFTKLYTAKDGYSLIYQNNAGYIAPTFSIE